MNTKSFTLSDLHVIGQIGLLPSSMVLKLRRSAGLVTCCLPWCVKLSGGHFMSIKTYKTYSGGGSWSKTYRAAQSTIIGMVIKADSIQCGLEIVIT